METIDNVEDKSKVMSAPVTPLPTTEWGDLKARVQQSKTADGTETAISTLTDEVDTQGKRVVHVEDKEKPLTVRQVAKRFEAGFMRQLDGGVSGGWSMCKFIDARDTYHFLKEPATYKQPGRRVNTNKWDIQAQNEFMGRFESALRRDFPKRGGSYVEFSFWLSNELQWAKHCALNVAYDPTSTQAEVKAILEEESRGWTYLRGYSVAHRHKLWQELLACVGVMQDELGKKD
jgi:hypothetical protein